jgi:hypothetical protein
LIIVDTDGGYIAWYQDVTTVTGSNQLTGWSYTDDQTILLAMNQGEFWEWALDGSEVAHETHWGDCSGAVGDDGPCPHHDLYRTSATGKTYVATGSTYDAATPSASNDFADWKDNSSVNEGFVNDGLRVYPSGFGTWTGYTLIDDMEFDPDSDGGPDPYCLGYWPNTFELSVCDWTHANSITAKQIGAVELVALSLREWSHVLQYRVDTNDLQWSVNGEDQTNYGTLSLEVDSGVTGEDGSDASFLGQHHVTYYGGGLLMFDNRKDAQLRTESTSGRVIQVDIDSTGGTATIVRSWVMREQGSPWAGLDCRQGLGSAVVVQGTNGDHVLATCGHPTVIQELDEYDGDNTRDPLLEISLDSSTSYDFCTTGTDPSQDDHTFYRAHPMVTLGEF